MTDVHDVSDTDAKSLAALDKVKERTSTRKEVDTGEAPNMKIKKFVEGMTPRDVQTLRVSWIKDTVKYNMEQTGLRKTVQTQIRLHLISLHYLPFHLHLLDA